MLYNIRIEQNIFASQMNMFHIHYSFDVQVETLIDNFSAKAISLDL